MIPEARTAIFNLGKNITGLSNNFYYMQAPGSVHEPYAVFSQVSNPFSQDSGNDFEDIYFQINIYSLSAAESGTIFEAAKTKFDNSESTLILNSFYVVRIQRQFTREALLDKVFMNSIQYHLQLQKK